MNRNPIPKVKLAGTVTVGPKGQVVIPYEVRERMGVKPGDKLIALFIPDKQAVGFVHERRTQAIIDKLGERLQPLT